MRVKRLQPKSEPDDYAFERYVLKAAALATLLIGLGLIFFSAHLVEWFEGRAQPDRHFAIYLGTALIGFSITNWLYSYSHDLAAIKPAITGNLVSLVIASAIDLWILISQGMGPVFLIMAVHLVFTGAFGYCLVAIRGTSR